MKTYIGIDNGVSGAVAALNDNGLQYAVLPIVKEFGRNWIDAPALQTLITALTDYNADAVVAYERPMGSQSAKAAKSMEASFAAIDTVCKLLELRRRPITPPTWQKTYWGKVDDTKAEALRVAKGLWPDRSFVKSERSQKPHDGIVDACLIAEWCRRIEVTE